MSAPRAIQPRPFRRPRRATRVGPFASRHIGPQADERDKMLAALGLTTWTSWSTQSMPRVDPDDGPLQPAARR